MKYVDSIDNLEGYVLVILGYKNDLGVDIFFIIY